MKLLYFLFGYKRINVKKEELSAFLSEVLKAGVECCFCSSQECLLPLWSVRRLRRLGLDKKYHFSEAYGLPGAIKRRFLRPGVILGVLFGFILNFFLSLPVWDVRIEGNVSLSERFVEESLREAGLEVGGLWHSIDKNSVEAHVLANNKDIAWLTVNRRGLVAYVKIKERHQAEIAVPDVGYSNIIADRDCVIKEITVKQGVAAVKAGDTVKKGDLLISGIVKTERGTLLTRAEGSVTGISQREISVFVPRAETRERIEKGEILKAGAKIFNFKLNIFKRYRNSQDSCDIIKENRDIRIFDKYDLPLSLEWEYSLHTVSETVEYTDLRLAELARERMNSAIYTLFLESDLLKMRSESNLSEEGLSLVSLVEYSTEVGVSREFEAE